MNITPETILGQILQNANIIAPVIAALVATVGWIAVHRFNVKRDRQNKRRDMIIQYLLEAYRRLESAAEREKSEEQAVAFEAALADIQLLGTEGQIKATVSYMQAHSDDGRGSINEILRILRNDLRKELGLSLTDGGPVIFRFERWQYGADQEIRTDPVSANG